MVSLQHEISQVKNQIKNIPTKLGGAGAGSPAGHYSQQANQDINNNNTNPDHLASVIEQHYEELSIAKKQILEHEGREVTVSS